VSLVRLRDERASAAALRTADVRIFDLRGRRSRRARGLRLRQVDASVAKGADAARAHGCYEVAWRARPVEGVDAARRHETCGLSSGAGPEGVRSRGSPHRRGQPVTALVRAGTRLRGTATAASTSIRERARGRGRAAGSS
jgi:hypothetical protein